MNDKRLMSVCMEMLGGKARDAILFAEITAFYANTKVRHRGCDVIIQTDQQLADRTGLSLPQVRRAKKYLLDNGYIQTVVKKSRTYHGGNNATHIHVPDTVMQLLKDIQKRHVQICTTGTEQNCITRIIPECTLPLYIEKIKSKGLPPKTGKIFTQQESKGIVDDEQTLNMLKGL
ncbi:MAG: hypothetical protein KDI13_11025 [Alphaproteobacteria bacterium]|nr:hypothetical protein [Alphaproteobacteria bacterium]